MLSLGSPEETTEFYVQAAARLKQIKHEQRRKPEDKGTVAI